MAISVRLSSDDELRALIAALKKRVFKAEVEEEVGSTRLKIARLLQENILLGLHSGRPGWSGLHDMTVAMKGSAQPLRDRGELENAIQVIEEGDKVFVGIPEGMKRTDGTSMELVAEVMENGAVIPVTDAVRGFFAANGNPLRKSTQAVVIPARPFFEPALAETEEQISEEIGVLQDRIIEELEK